MFLLTHAHPGYPSVNCAKKGKKDAWRVMTAWGDRRKALPGKSAPACSQCSPNYYLYRVKKYQYCFVRCWIFRPLFMPVREAHDPSPSHLCTLTLEDNHFSVYPAQLTPQTIF